MLIRAVIPAAGVGSRVLPITNGVPKELLPINGRPLIRFSIDEALDSGINHIGIVTRKEKVGLNRYLRGIEDLASVIEFIDQRIPNRLGQAVLKAEKWVGGDDFAVLLPDDIITYHEPCPVQLYRLHEKYSCTVLGIEHTVDTEKYGIVTGEKIDDNLLKVEKMVEKPDPSISPSRMGIIGRYLLTPEIFSCIRKVARQMPNNVELTDALNLLLRKEDVYAVKVRGKRYDCGNVEGYRRAVENIRDFENSNTTSIRRVYG